MAKSKKHRPAAGGKHHRPAADRTRAAKYAAPLPEKKRAGVDPTTTDRVYDEEQSAFLKAMDAYKRANRRPWPTWSEAMAVLISLGYRRTEPAGPPPGAPAAGSSGAGDAGG